MEKIIGREPEKDLLKRILANREAELVAIYGRRRVGKTFLIRNIFEKEMIFEISGIHNAPLDQQLENFQQSLSKSAGIIVETPKSWLQAFQMLENFLARKIKRSRRVVFFDEFPWIHTARSGFLEAFTNFWNMWASRQSNLIVVICGSAASWMIQKVINNKGGLHNRVTQRIRLLPFSIGETEFFLKERGVNLGKYQMLELYMAMGGIPQYLKEVRPGESATQAIDRTCFTDSGFLHTEFKNLFHSLFDKAHEHIKVVRALAQKSSGLSRNEIIEVCDLTTGGGTTQLLDELMESGFIAHYIPFNRTAKDAIYKLTDEYSNFYIKFIEHSRFKGKGSWANFSDGASWRSWSGNAFESICMKHIDQIKKALEIRGVHTETSVWRYRPQKAEQGAQIDLLIDRRDMCINVCEIKFSVNEYELTKSYAKELEAKLRTFKQQSKTKKTLFLTMITTFGVKNKEGFPGLIQSEITMESLFAT